MTDEQFIKENPDAQFIGRIQVGNNGVVQYYTDPQKYLDCRDKVWESGHPCSVSVLKGKELLTEYL